MSWRPWATNYLKSFCFNFKLMEKFSPSTHHLRSNSNSGSAVEKNKQCPRAQIRHTLKKEILELEQELQDQFMVRCALEHALTTPPFYSDIAINKSIPEPAKELMNEIAVLELEVAYLEKYLLSLYRRSSNKKVLPSSTRDDKCKLTTGNEVMHQEAPELDIISDKEKWAIHTNNAFGSLHYSNENLRKISEDMRGMDKLIDSSIHRSHSSLSQSSACSVRTSPKSLAKAVDSYHSLPLSMLEKSQMDIDTSGGTSLAEHLGNSIRFSHHVLETPNQLSEDMIKCISAIYCELAYPPLRGHDLLSSPISCSSSMEITCSQDQGDMWSPQSGEFSSFNSRYGNSFSVGKSMGFSGPYCSVVKIRWICRDSKKLGDVEDKLQRYRSLVYQLEEVDVRRLNQEEKLAFWINVHNALVMHQAFLVYGIPKSSFKRVSLLLKAAYKVGGEILSVDMIQSMILRCRLPRPAGQWRKILFPSSSRRKLKGRGDMDAGKAYMIEHPEPRLYFALCSGSYSDPMVRVYTAKEVDGQLEAAKQEYIESRRLMSSVKQKVKLPKLVEVFAKESDLCLTGLVEQCMPRLTHHSPKCIRWIPHNFSFQYILSTQLST